MCSYIHGMGTGKWKKRETLEEAAVKSTFILWFTEEVQIVFVSSLSWNRMSVAVEAEVVVGKKSASQSLHWE